MHPQLPEHALRLVRTSGSSSRSSSGRPPVLAPSVTVAVNGPIRSLTVTPRPDQGIPAWDSPVSQRLPTGAQGSDPSHRYLVAGAAPLAPVRQRGAGSDPIGSGARSRCVDPSLLPARRGRALTPAAGISAASSPPAWPCGPAYPARRSSNEARSTRPTSPTGSSRPSSSYEKGYGPEPIPKIAHHMAVPARTRAVNSIPRRSSESRKQHARSSVTA
jgi:hypothetical protein